MRAVVMVTVSSGTKSTFGDQVLSNKASEPKVKFGSSTRTDKIYDGKEFMTRNYGKNSQGCTSKVSSGFGAQSSSKNLNAPLLTFGNRPPSDFLLKGRTLLPGPGYYETEEFNSKKILSKRVNDPNWKIGSSNRWSQFASNFKSTFETPAAIAIKYPMSDICNSPAFTFNSKAKRADISTGLPGLCPTYLRDPGPGTYQSLSGFGSQVEGKRQSMPNAKVGKEKPQQYLKQYLSIEHERALLGIFSPAPNNYPSPSSIGNQPSSRKKSSPRVKFGTSDRFSDTKSKGNREKDKMPGPGAYVV